MDLIGIDFETRSEVDLTKHGAHKYFAGKQADIVFLSYKINHEPTKQWFPGDPLPDFIKTPSNYHFYAFNALFEFRAWNRLGQKHGYGTLLLSDLTDVMAICGRFAFPQKLDAAGEVLNLKMQKDKRGKELINKICCPPFSYSAQEYSEFKAYGIRDVDSMYEMLYALPATKLSEREQKIWELTQIINLRGLPIDIKSVHQIARVTEAYKQDQNELLPSLTGGNVTKATQAARIKNWINRFELLPKLNNLQAKTVSDLLDITIPRKVSTLQGMLADYDGYLAYEDKIKKQIQELETISLVLTLRQDLGRSSTAKYQKLIDQTHNGFIYDNLRYAGANTLRWAGMGFQLHNLPRSKVKDAKPIIDKFFDYSIIEENPVAAAKDIIRGMICAPKGKMLLFMDYSSIENRILYWYAGHTKALQRLADGYDEYKDMAAFLYNKEYDNVIDTERQFGKALILGCGFGLGHVGFIDSAASWGINLTPLESKKAVDAYRNKNKPVVKLWYACKDAAINAISNPGHTFKVGKLKFKVIQDKNGNRWLTNMLPSGRAIYYNDPQIGEGKFGAEPSAMGINPYSKKWQRLKIIPGRFVENAVQASARDVLADGKIALHESGYDLRGSIHDEAISLIDSDLNKEVVLAQTEQLMCNSSPWAEGLPLAAEGVIEKRYRKM